MQRTLRSSRRRLGLTQAEVARRAGIDRVTYARIEGSTGGNPKLVTLCRLAKALRVPVARLVTL